jgi:hypothetical protein
MKVRRPQRAARMVLLIFAATILGGLPARPAWSQCTETLFQNYTGAGQTVCPCFVSGEQAGAVFTLPAAAYPVEILKVGIGWGSQLGGAGQSIEEAIHIYAGGLPNPGSPIFSLPGPVLTDGVINEFTLPQIPGGIVIPSGPFTVTLEFLNDNAGDFFAPSVVHDGNGCQSGKNVIFAIPGGWLNACTAGVSGDWVFYVKYRSLKVTAAASPTQVTFSSAPAFQTTCSSFNLVNTGCDTLLIKGISGCGSAPFSIDTTATAHSVAPGAGTPIGVCVTPTSNGAANCSITVKSNASNGPTTVNVALSAVTAVGSPGLPGFAIVGVVPNPFNPETSIRFALPEALAVTAEVWSVDGSRVTTLASNEVFPAGEDELRWDGRNARGERVASGVYLFRITTTLGRLTTRLVLLE